MCVHTRLFIDTCLAPLFGTQCSHATHARASRFCCRDIDSRLSVRERVAVLEWEQSGMPFHVMRDHPSHVNYAMSGGMWCAMCGGSDPGAKLKGAMSSLLQKFAPSVAYLQDMDFLNSEIWPIALENGVMQHDSFGCRIWQGSKPFKTQRQDWEHVGSVFVDGKMRQGDVDLLKGGGSEVIC